MAFCTLVKILSNGNFFTLKGSNLLDLLASFLLPGEVVGFGDLLEDLLVDSLQRNAIEIKGTGHEEDSLRQVLQENNMLATETTLL